MRDERYVVEDSEVIRSAQRIIREERRRRILANASTLVTEKISRRLLMILTLCECGSEEPVSMTLPGLRAQIPGRIMTDSQVRSALNYCAKRGYMGRMNRKRKGDAYYLTKLGLEYSGKLWARHLSNRKA